MTGILKAPSANRIGKTIQESRKEKGLTQEDLARRADVPYTTLTKIESGAIKNPSAKVVSKLAAALGVSLDTLVVPRIYEGPESVQQIFDDVLGTPIAPGDFMCISGIDEQRYLEHTSDGVIRFVAELKEKGISQKLLSCEGDTVFLDGDHLEYRWIPKKFYSPVPIYVYGNKVATLIWGPPVSSMVIENASLAEAYRRQFLFIWEHATPVSRKTKARR